MAALLVLFVMAATSHDFWLMFLTPRVWKALHMSLYVAYALVVMHVALGSLQDEEQRPFVPLMLIGGFGTVAVLHLIAGWRERMTDKGSAPSDADWIAVVSTAVDLRQSRPHCRSRRRRTHRRVP